MIIIGMIPLVCSMFDFSFAVYPGQQRNLVARITSGTCMLTCRVSPVRADKEYLRYDLPQAKALLINAEAFATYIFFMLIKKEDLILSSNLI